MVLYCDRMVEISLPFFSGAFLLLVALIGFIDFLRNWILSTSERIIHAQQERKEKYNLTSIQHVTLINAQQDFLPNWRLVIKKLKK